MPPRAIQPDLYALNLGGVNAFVIRAADGLTLIDTGYPGSSVAIANQLAVLGHSLTAIKRIIVTHCHPDHAGGLAELQALTGAAAWMHPADATMVQAGVSMRASIGPTPGLVNYVIYKIVIARAARSIPPAEVAHVVADGAELPGGLQVIHTPGHSAGQIALWWPRHGGVLFVADNAINVAGLALFPAYEDLARGRRSLALLAGLDFQIACFGHGRTILRNAAAQFRGKWGG